MLQYVLLAAGIILHAVATAATIRGMHKHGEQVEANPVMRAILKRQHAPLVLLPLIYGVLFVLTILLPEVNAVIINAAMVAVWGADCVKNLMLTAEDG
jgi:hypothetical protein